MQKEIEIQRSLDHPNILRIYEIYDDDKMYYLLTELCSGGELYDELAVRGQFSESDCAQVVQ
jgi:calcium-dependent protein kinase